MKYFITLILAIAIYFAAAADAAASGALKQCNLNEVVAPWGDTIAAPIGECFGIYCNAEKYRAEIKLCPLIYHPDDITKCNYVEQTNDVLYPECCPRFECEEEEQ